MGVVAKQSGWSSIAIGIGILFGALNTIVILPRAFEGAEDEWGLIRILASWGIIFSSISVIGTPSGIVRFLPKYDPKEQPDILRTMLILPTLGLFIFLIVFGLFGHRILPLFDGDKGSILSHYLPEFLLITSSMLISSIIRALVIQQLNTILVSWVDEAWQKGSFLILGLLLYFEKIDFVIFLNCYIMTWCVSTIILFMHARRLPQRIGKKWSWEEFNKILSYSLFNFFSGGVKTIASHLDFVMIAMYAGLAQIPIYTIGVFLGTLVGMPLRATQGVITSITSRLVALRKTEELQALSRRSGRVNSLLATCIMAGIWAGLLPFQLLLPEHYQGLAIVFVCFGFQRLIFCFSHANNSILGFSPWYRLNLPINLGLIIITILSNYFFLVTLDLGIKGAAFATLGTAIWNSSWRLVIVWRKLRVHPFTWSLAFIPIIGWVCASCFHWDGNTFSHPLIGAVVQGILGCGSTLLLCSVFGFFPELKDGIKARISRTS
jgi:O-antigen/teichoic acid export membrane protein